MTRKTRARAIGRYPTLISRKWLRSSAPWTPKVNSKVALEFLQAAVKFKPVFIVNRDFHISLYGSWPELSRS